MENKQLIAAKLKSMMNGQIRMDSKNVNKYTLFDTTKYKVKHLIKLSQMPSWSQILDDVQIFQDQVGRLNVCVNSI